MVYDDSERKKSMKGRLNAGKCRIQPKTGK
jgi:hypothetical protein